MMALVLAFVAGVVAGALVLVVPRGPTGWCIRRWRVGGRVVETVCHVRVRRASDAAPDETPAG